PRRRDRVRANDERARPYPRPSGHALPTAGRARRARSLLERERRDAARGDRDALGGRPLDRPRAHRHDRRRPRPPHVERPARELPRADRGQDGTHRGGGLVRGGRRSRPGLHDLRDRPRQPHALADRVALDRAAELRRTRRVVRAAYRSSPLGPAAVIVTVTLNAALDRTLEVPNFQLGHRHRASESLTLAGGKGINVARALKRMGVPVVATGLAGGRTGTRIVEELTTEAILNDFVRIGGESRTSTAVVDTTTGSYTEINEWGPRVEEAELEILLEKLHYLANRADYVVFAGSLPRGVETGFYGEAIRDLKRRGIQTILDSEGEPLRFGTEAEPWLVSPNQPEAEGLVGQELNDAEDFMMALDVIADRGAQNVLITQETGCVARFREERRARRFRARSPRLEAL